MKSGRKFSKENAVLVSVPSKLSLEQTQHITKEILGIVGCPSCYSGFKFQFIDEGEIITARFSENQELSIH
ncbi:hypothetical protein [Mucilaginibacter gotjawali]|uniref:Uncharacterized protein n=1 Tax=Mucilaginibacter gotjawali TaxID=1550579 RepID=A0A839SKU1_9SPHI|nr:hypothetical protein [Mucilaginibacter gotjawali]MBB3057149.1 hypothetical protein [Mucilaginibacter gotjawali]